MSSQALSGSAALSRCVVRSLKTNCPFRDAYEGPRLYRSLTSTRTLAPTQRCSVQGAQPGPRPGRHARVRGALRPCLPVSRVRGWTRCGLSGVPPPWSMVGWRRGGGCVLPAPQARAPLLTFTHPPAPLFHGSRSYYSQGSHHGSSTALNNSQRLSDGPWRHLGGAVAVVPNNK